MTKQIQNLRKRIGAIQYDIQDGVSKDKELDANDIVQLFHENGASLSAIISEVQEEGTFIGSVINITNDIPGISVNDKIVSNINFIFSLSRRT